MNNKIKKISIKSKITVAFLFLTMVATLLITGLSLHLSKENVFLQSQRQQLLIKKLTVQIR